jgi:hypothetical protein
MISSYSITLTKYSINNMICAPKSIGEILRKGNFEVTQLSCKTLDNTYLVVNITQQIRECNSPDKAHSCFAWDSISLADIHNATNDGQQQGHRLLPSHKHIYQTHISIEFIPLFPGPQTTNTLLPFVKG